MAYKKRIPPISVELTITKFNSLIEYLSNIVDEDKKVVADKLKEKLLRYSIPNITESETFIVIRFFSNEAVKLISLLSDKLDYEIQEINYYEILLKNRRKNKEEE